MPFLVYMYYIIKELGEIHYVLEHGTGTLAKLDNENKGLKSLWEPGVDPQAPANFTVGHSNSPCRPIMNRPTECVSL